jgi:hypothetical protein
MFLGVLVGTGDVVVLDWVEIVDSVVLEILDSSSFPRVWVASRRSALLV